MNIIAINSRVKINLKGNEFDGKVGTVVRIMHMEWDPQAIEMAKSTNEKLPKVMFLVNVDDYGFAHWGNGLPLLYADYELILLPPLPPIKRPELSTWSNFEYVMGLAGEANLANTITKDK